jgi:hypothetical protein
VVTRGSLGCSKLVWGPRLILQVKNKTFSWPLSTSNPETNTVWIIHGAEEMIRTVLLLGPRNLCALRFQCASLQHRVTEEETTPSVLWRTNKTSSESSAVCTTCRRWGTGGYRTQRKENGKTQHELMKPTPLGITGALSEKQKWEERKSKGK